MAHRIDTKKIVCLGGGVGTSVLLSGLKKYSPHLSVITSMADDGGSSGRLRKAYNIMPPGDIVSCIASLIPETQKDLKSLLVYRFPGHNMTNKAIDGHKLGNLIMLAEIQRTGNFYQAIEATKKLFSVTGDFYPATDERVHLSAITTDGRRIHSETTLDLARYAQPHGLKKIYIRPARPKVNPKVVQALEDADVIISGPGDLYTNQLPVLIVPQIKEALLSSRAKKIFVLNIANKPLVSKGFALSDFVQAIKDHIGAFPFDTIVANSNYSIPIPRKFDYTYIEIDTLAHDPEVRISKTDLVAKDFPLYHDAAKLAEAIVKTV
ncbi:MAG TPA: gluconeogenesis factor YvcK family protein [Patescibacteria group bacterium]|nr:gluconeogenesis factor YvcK family protein [Patescibacteria group bacterium]